MWQEINAYVQEALVDNSENLEKLNAALKAANGDGEAALAHLFLMDLVRDRQQPGHQEIRRFALGINPAVRAEAERSQS